MLRAIRQFVKPILRRAFEGAGGGPRWPLPSAMWSPVREALAARHRLAARAGFVVANSPSAEAVASVWVSNLIGNGPSARSQHPNRAMRRALESAWTRFYSRCGFDGLDLTGILCLAVRSLVIGGEALIVLTATPRGEVRLRVLSAEQLDSSLNRDGIAHGGRVIAGVEFNALGERVAYWIFREQPDLVASMLGPSVRVPAEDVIYIFDQKIPGQVRGISWLTAVLTRLVELDKLEDALSARMNTAALFGAFVTDVDGTAFADAAPPTGAQSELSLEPGIVRRLPPGASVIFPDVPGIEGAPELLRHLIRSIGSGTGIPYELLSGDLGQVNYSSAKAGFSQFQRRCKTVRASLLVARFLQPVWQRVVTLEILSGRLYAPDFERSSEDYFTVSFLFPDWELLDPLKEASADEISLRNGLSSRQEIIAARGRDPEDVDAEIAADTFTPRPVGPGAKPLEIQNAPA